MNNELTPNKKETPISASNTGTNMPVQEDTKTSPKEPPEKRLTAAPTKKLDEILPESGTNLLYISGTLAGHDNDCEGPIEFPFKLDRPMWPLTPIQPNPNYKHQRFDYDSGTWIATDAKSQGQQITDLTKQIAKLNQDSIKHDQAAEQSQKIVMQQMQMFTAINTKLDKLTKGGDK